MKYFKYFVGMFLLGSITTGCFDDNDDVVPVASVAEINDFIWKGMNTFYLYKDDVPDLANNRFSSEEEYNNFLNSFASPEAIFEALQSNIDEFSFLVADYVALEQSFDGLTMNNGMEFGLIRYPDGSGNVFGYVRYVLPNTDAESKGVERGNIFNTINDTQITQDNFRGLINLDSYTIGLATFDGTNVTPTGASISLTKVPYVENPVFISKTINNGGNLVGYLMYNAFTSDFDDELNAAIGDLKSAGITDLVLDVRYNGGGSVESAIDLSSMITGQFNGEIFTVDEWNSELQNQFGQIRRFNQEIKTGEAINSLNLSRVYILTTGRSASASELVINGLDPYIEVIQVGTNTSGKFQASRTVYDSPDFGRQGANLGHTYAMQPLVLRSINSVGFTDYFDGFTPEIEIAEDFTNLGVLGDPDEPLLRTALNAISGTRIATKSHTVKLESIGDSNMFSPIYERMYE
ncbi:S41 family peptidase [Aquimarina spongiae]|uniref:Peptidase family S41 n=1 Tax=Aquimarina spongiae TaxID=570521 RepID=A0A1M6DB82_9FLAO|nr:S41 family peptidase [Aquimarina spongiae]SHI70494.1 Peptidase family S41 [Aquimarina spongiae]